MSDSGGEAELYREARRCPGYWGLPGPEMSIAVQSKFNWRTDQVGLAFLQRGRTEPVSYQKMRKRSGEAHDQHRCRVSGAFSIRAPVATAQGRGRIDDRYRHRVVRFLSLWDGGRTDLRQALFPE